MPTFPLAPTHLSLFVTDPETGRPVTALPLYAEVAVPRIIPIVPVNDRVRQPLRAALLAIDPTAVGDVLDRVERAALAALGQVVDQATADALAADPQRVQEVFERVFTRALGESDRDRLADIPVDELTPGLVRALREVGPRVGLPLVPLVENRGIAWADPLGVLTTDHVGYVSFDLTRLRPDVQVMLATAIEKRRSNPDLDLGLAIWVYPYGSGTKFDALSQARFAYNAVVAHYAMSWHTLPPGLINMGPRALQNPSLTDWQLSPASFAASPKTLLGDDHCEELLPASLALQEFVLRQVVRLTDPPDGIVVPAPYKPAYVDEYKVAWYSLGHSLGEILCSLPLAPGETVKLAVIDWSWDSLTKRDETTRLTEDVLHQTHRDRTITETVKAGLREMQRGSSFMGGAAGASGASGGANVGIASLGGAVGNTWSLGGSTATSIGSRDLAAENVQRLNDNFSQASSSQRELHSTVVVQARQEEKESIQTRTFSNYNHSHTLTILYYEVLRHFRVTVEWVRRRPAVLIKLPAKLTFDAATTLKHRWQLEPALLDKAYAAGFTALEKREAIRAQLALNGIPNGLPGAPAHWEGDLLFEMFELGIQSKEGEGTEEPVVVYLITKDSDLIEKKYELRYVYKGSGPIAEPHNINSGPRMDHEWGVWTFVKPFNMTANRFEKVRWADIMGFQFEKWGDSDVWRIDFLTINALGPEGVFVSLTEGQRDVDLYYVDEEPGSQSFTWIKRPGPRAPDIPPVLSAEKSLSAEENASIARLLTHLEDSTEYYNRAVRLTTDPNAIAVQFEALDWTPSLKLDDAVQPYPLEVFGSYVAYPLGVQPAGVDDTLVVDIAAALNGTDAVRRQWAQAKLDAMTPADRQRVLDRLPLASAKSERLITLPTRGVFAEGKLGHCNVSEEIDNTRFWKWDEHPIPIEAPGINPVTPVQPSPQAVNVTPTAFPQSLVNIVNPSAAPDPTGLAAALTLLGTPNIFRDMSGQQNVTDLLKKLSDNAVAIADVANKARPGTSGSGGGNVGGSTAATTTATTGPGGTTVRSSAASVPPRPSPTEQLDQLQVLRNAAKNGDITEAQQKEFAGAYLKDSATPHVMLATAFSEDLLDGGAGGAGGTSNVSPFSTKLYPTEMVPGASHNARLTSALQTVRATLATPAEQKTFDEIAIFVAKLTPSGTMEFAGVREHEMFFSGSLLKLTLLYASFELVERVNALAPFITAGSAADFFAKVKADFDPKIVNTVPHIAAGPWRQVSYDKVVSATPSASGRFNVTMNPTHEQELRSIFNNPNQNEGAKGCIRRLGYSFVNANNDAAGFFGLQSQTGIWMATDYVPDDADPPIPGNWPSFNVPVVGGTSAAACTCISVANLLTRMHRDELIDATASQRMRGIFATGAPWLMDPGAGGPYSFTSTGAKVGHAKSDTAHVGMVKSEAVYLKRTDGVPFVCVWQNVPDSFPFKHVYKVIDDVVKTWP